MSNVLQLVPLEERIVLDAAFFVNVNAAPGGDGTAALPYNDLQTALDNASGTTVIKVTEGTYLPSVLTLAGDSRSKSFVIPDNVTILGSYDSTFTTSNPFFTPTILSGDTQNDNNSGNNVYSVVRVNGATVTLDGLTISEGNNTKGSLLGAAITEIGSNLTLNMVTIKDNRAGNFLDSSAGVFSISSVLVITFSDFLNNISTKRGAAIYTVSDDFVSISNTHFDSNQAEVGGAYYSETDTEIHFNFNIFTNNSADDRGGAVSIVAASGEVTIENTTFDDNTADNRGGALFLQLNNNVTIETSIFTNNSSGLEGGGAIKSISNQGVVHIESSLFQDNSSTGGGGAWSSSGTSGSGASFEQSDESVNNTFINNSAPAMNDLLAGGGALFLNAANVTVTGSTFIDNSSLFNNVGTGGAIQIFSSFNTLISANLFKNNSADTGGAIALWGNMGTFIVSGSVTFPGSTSATISNNRFEGNAADLRGGAIWFANNEALEVDAALVTNTFNIAITGNIFNAGNTAGLSQGGGAIYDAGENTSELASLVFTASGNLYDPGYTVAENNVLNVVDADGFLKDFLVIQGGTASLSSSSSPNGTVVLSGTGGAFTYTPDADVFGPDYFANYRVTDPAQGNAFIMPGTILFQVGAQVNAFQNVILFDEPLAIFYEPNAGLAAAVISTIDWGDGSSTTSGSLEDLAGDYWAVKGTHTYDMADTFVITVTLNYPTGVSSVLDGLTSVIEGQAIVTTELFTESSMAISSIEGIPFSNHLLGTFVELNAAVLLADLDATIDWGDFTSDVLGPNLFIVAALDQTGLPIGAVRYETYGSHTYDSVTPLGFPNTYSVEVTDPSGFAAIIENSATVASSLVADNSETVNVTEGQNFPGFPTFTLLGTFINNDTSEPITNIDVTVQWGDSSSDTLLGGNLSIVAIPHIGFQEIQVFGNHLYQQADNYNILVQIEDNTGSGSEAMVSSSAVVADALVTPTGVPFNPAQTVSFTGIVATFTDANLYDPVTDFVAVIDWGDGDTSAGIITPLGGGQFEVSGTHTYTSANPLDPPTVTVDITEIDGGTVSVSYGIVVDPFQISTTPLNRQVDQNGTETISISSLLSFISFAPGDSLSFTVDSFPVGSTFTINATNFVLKPGLGVADVMQVYTYNVTDISNGTFAIGTINLQVDAVGPVANPETFATKQNTAFTVTAAKSVLNNDTFPAGDTITLALPSISAHGTLTNINNSNGTFTYTPATGFFGKDTLAYTITTSHGLSSTGIVTINVGQTIPLAIAESYLLLTTPANKTLKINAANGVLANDLDPGNKPKAYLVTKPKHGTLTLKTDGSFTYTAKSGFVGIDTFKYYLQDSSKTPKSNTVQDQIVVRPLVSVAGINTSIINGPMITSASLLTNAEKDYLLGELKLL